MKLNAWIRSILPFAFLSSILRARQRMGKRKSQINVATLGRPPQRFDEFFYYEQIKLRHLRTTEFREEGYSNYSAIFIYPSFFAEAAKAETRTLLQEIAAKVPLVFVGAQHLDTQSLFDRAFSYEELMNDSGPHEYIQVLFYFPNGEDCPFQTDGFHWENQKELAQAIQFMQKSSSYTQWERAFYEY